MTSSLVLESQIPSLPVRRGKVRDVYDLGDKLLLVASDRISAFDYILPSGIPDKGRVLTQISSFWFEKLPGANHVLSTEIDDAPLPAEADREALRGRSMLVRKTEVVPIECVVRGYLSGSGWKEYRTSGTVCGIKLPAGLKESDRLPEPIFTPATKAESGHDENISFEEMVRLVGSATAEELRTRSLDVYRRGAEYALTRGIIIADTKFEFGIPDSGGDPIVIDEALTPDSSRFWPADTYEPGKAQRSFDKQYLREYLQGLVDRGLWNKQAPGPELPDSIVSATLEKYRDACERLV